MNSWLEILISNLILSTLLAIVATLVSKFWNKPALSHALWLLVFIKLVTPALFVVSLPQTVPGDALAEEPLIADVAVNYEGLPELETGETSFDFSDFALTPPPVELVDTEIWSSLSWQSALLMLWGFGSALLLLLASLQHRKLLKVLQQGKQPSDALQQLTDQTANEIGVTKTPQVLVTSLCVSPLVSFWKVRLVLLMPEKLIEGLDPSQQKLILAHELIHVRRRDYLVRLFECFVLLLFWWNPIVWYASRQLRHAEELCCDSSVVEQFPKQRKAYGQVLLQTVEYLTEKQPFKPITASAFGSSSFPRRIEMIMKQKAGHRLTWVSASFCLLLAALIIPLSAQETSEKSPGEKLPVDKSITLGEWLEDYEAGIDVESDQGNVGEINPGQKTSPLPSLGKKGDDKEEGADGDAGFGIEGSDSVEGSYSFADSDNTEAGFDGEGYGDDFAGAQLPTIFRGVIQASNDIQIAARIDGEIEQLNVKEGDMVEKGQLIVSLDSQDLNLELLKAEAELMAAIAGGSSYKAKEVDLLNAAKEFERISTLHKQGVVSQKELAEVDSKLRVAKVALETAKQQIDIDKSRVEFLKASLELAKRKISRCQCRAPIDGMVIEVKRHTGEPVQAGTPICRIINLNNLSVTAYLDLDSAADLKGKTVTLVARNQRGETQQVKGKVTFVSPIVQPSTNKILVRAEFKKPEKKGHLFQPGRSVILSLK